MKIAKFADTLLCAAAWPRLKTKVSPIGSRSPCRAEGPPGFAKFDSPKGRTRAVPRDSLNRGGADRARPGTRRMMSASDRRFLASSGVYPPPGLLQPQSGQTAEMVFVIRHGPCCHAIARTMSATGPFRPRPPHLPFGWLRKATRPGGWLCTVSRPPASGATMVSASPNRSPYVGTPDPRHSLPPGPKRSRSIRQRKWDEYDMGVEGGEKILNTEHSLAFRSKVPNIR